jgi:hypothetical protein
MLSGTYSGQDVHGRRSDQPAPGVGDMFLTQKRQVCRDTPGTSAVLVRHQAASRGRRGTARHGHAYSEPNNHVLGIFRFHWSQKSCFSSEQRADRFACCRLLTMDGGGLSQSLQVLI